MWGDEKKEIEKIWNNKKYKKINSKDVRLITLTPNQKKTIF